MKIAHADWYKYPPHEIGTRASCHRDWRFTDIQIYRYSNIQIYSYLCTILIWVSHKMNWWSTNSSCISVSVTTNSQLTASLACLQTGYRDDGDEDMLTETLSMLCGWHFNYGDHVFVSKILLQFTGNCFRQFADMKNHKYIGNFRRRGHFGAK